MPVFVILFALLLSGVGLVMKKYPETISGYSTMSAERRKNVDLKAVGALMNRAMQLTAALTLAFYFTFRLLDWPALALASLVAPMGLVLPPALITALKYDRNPRSRVARYLPPVLVTLLLSALTVIIGVNVHKDLKPAEAAIEGGAINFKGRYGVTVPLEEIAVAELWSEDKLPRITHKMGGFALDGVYKGTFRLDGLGRCRLFITQKTPPYLYIETTGGAKIIFNSPDPARTRGLFYSAAPYSTSPTIRQP